MPYRSSQSSSSPPPPPPPPPLPQHLQLKTLPILSSSEKETYNLWLSSLTPSEKSTEKESIEKSLHSLQTRLSLLTLESSTFRGQLKSLTRDYGFPFLVYWWSLWGVTGIICYGSISFFSLDVPSLLKNIDTLINIDVSGRIDPDLGEVAVAVAVNELLEPVRLPFVVVTTKKLVDTLGYGPKYN
ncbi:hypothetical protein TrST_g6748 [Triparma strigata]|uniref:DUF1279 domain-containing protein n=1 Tax=Triparma strigata TaxID=1606541 RepID=A0A9W7F1I4_9STRA|nr:hypothetical protein TrST_g6748 [Triparma strigata]